MDRNDLQLMTIYKAKGLEFKIYLFILVWNNGHFLANQKTPIKTGFLKMLLEIKIFIMLLLREQKKYAI